MSVAYTFDSAFTCTQNTRLAVAYPNAATHLHRNRCSYQIPTFHPGGMRNALIIFFYYQLFIHLWPSNSLRGINRHNGRGQSSSTLTIVNSRFTSQAFRYLLRRENGGTEVNEIRKIPFDKKSVKAHTIISIRKWLITYRKDFKAKLMYVKWLCTLFCLRRHFHNWLAQGSLLTLRHIPSLCLPGYLLFLKGFPFLARVLGNIFIVRGLTEAVYAYIENDWIFLYVL